jgi:hypothetical protein
MQDSRFIGRDSHDNFRSPALLHVYGVRHRHVSKKELLKVVSFMSRARMSPQSQNDKSDMRYTCIDDVVGAVLIDGVVQDDVHHRPAHLSHASASDVCW